MKTHFTRFNVGGLVIAVRSGHAPIPIARKLRGGIKEEAPYEWAPKDNKPPDILINIRIARKLPKITEGKLLFTATSYDSKISLPRWRLFKTKKGYIYEDRRSYGDHLTFLGQGFNRADCRILSKDNFLGRSDVDQVFDQEQIVFIKKKKGLTWQISDIHNLIQVIMLNYLSKDKLGIFCHASGVNHLSKEGFIFAGRSGVGKSTTARLWLEHAGASILNDDRIIIRRRKGKFFIYGFPREAEFDGPSTIDTRPVQLKKIFFIYHAPRNIVRRINRKEAFTSMYTSLFAPFWDEGFLKNAVDFSSDLTSRIPCYSLGFINDKSAVEFVKKI